MKYLPPRESFACFILAAILLAIARAGEPTVDPSKLYIVESKANAFLLVDSNYTIHVGGWLRIFGNRDKRTRETGPYTIAATRIEAKAEPRVTQNADGSWVITFSAP